LHTAAVCVYPSRLVDIIEERKVEPRLKDVKACAVAAGFPSGQYRIETKELEVKLAAEDGADEIDIVINRADALQNKWGVVYDELKRLRQAAPPKVCLKTILATGELRTMDIVYKASLVAMMANCDFIKTSTGKEAINATLPVCFVMCKAIKDFYQKTNRKVGLKIAGGVRSADQALAYLCLAREELGESWIVPNLLRFGASALLNETERKLFELL